MTKLTSLNVWATFHSWTQKSSRFKDNIIDSLGREGERGGVASFGGANLIDFKIASRTAFAYSITKFWSSIIFVFMVPSDYC